MERKTKVHVACSHAHMFTTCLSYQFTGGDMPLQKLSGVAIFVSLQECPTQGNQMPKLGGLRSTSSNAITASQWCIVLCDPCFVEARTRYFVFLQLHFFRFLMHSMADLQYGAILK